jgi:hypothetical protein
MGHANKRAQQQHHWRFGHGPRLPTYLTHRVGPPPQFLDRCLVIPSRIALTIASQEGGSWKSFALRLAWCGYPKPGSSTAEVAMANGETSQNQIVKLPEPGA